ncbi:hypothetical protein P153DRAFT_400194 [Dothidotthia symphoricarpi CBS 119687]|uniref:Uncharacterized protein n=1 Tax=Dothidotthia symphoricarpi CBS 119687 TaxID=1392245 RepID=A0A6A6A1G8_9PLEO|nr:uncharacterized protein P153DRAFT_400194 [Dothidotthia symphoricarpi CBS 119687]KAF2125366.1 hypothetical protein P153DRAFT_400194 [Dothidotthia symphoricarpi CBS 119687]
MTTKQPTKQTIKTLLTTPLLLAAERLIPTYPPHFPTIEHAKTHISHHCAAAHFTYGSPPAHLRDRVRDRVHFLVAVRAYEAGEFYLDEGLVDRAALRNAIERDIARVLPLIRVWPREFPDVGAAKLYVEGVCFRAGFRCGEFGGVAQGRFRGYVVFNAVRRGFERGLFGLRSCEGVEGWRVGRTAPTFTSAPASGERFACLKDAIDFDVERLVPLVRGWPARFTDINAARNFVGGFCYDVRFRYSGYGDVEAHRYRMFVNFHTAKRAFGEGRFVLDVQMLGVRKQVLGGKLAEENGAVEEKTEMDGGAVAGSTPVKKSEVDSVPVYAADTEPETETAESEVPATVLQLATPFDRRRDDSANANQDVEELGVHVDTDTEVSASPSSTLHDSVVDENEKVDDLGSLPTVQADPFKDLLAELRREFVLKAAFE